MHFDNLVVLDLHVVVKRLHLLDTSVQTSFLLFGTWLDFFCKVFTRGNDALMEAEVLRYWLYQSILLSVLELCQKLLKRLNQTNWEWVNILFLLPVVVNEQVLKDSLMLYYVHVRIFIDLEAYVIILLRFLQQCNDRIELSLRIDHVTRPFIHYGQPVRQESRRFGDIAVVLKLPVLTTSN